MNELSNGSTGHTLQENLQHIRDVYCMHPMVLDLLDFISELQDEIKKLNNGGF